MHFLVANEAPQSEQDPFPLQKRIKTEPKDDYELAEEECAKKAGNPTPLQTESDRWKYEQNHSASPVFGRIPSFAAEECHQFNDNCKQCVINEARQADMDNMSLHHRRQIREFEQGDEQPLGNKVREWKEKRLEKSLTVRGLPRAVLRMEDEEGFYQRIEKDSVNQESCDQPSYEHQLSRDDPRGHHVIQHEGLRDQIVVPREHHVISPREHVISPREEHLITNEHHVVHRDSSEIRYLLTHPTGGPTIVSTEGDVDMQMTADPISPGNQPIAMGATSMPVVLTSPGVVSPEYINGMGGAYPRVSLPHTQTTTAKVSSSKVAKKRSRQQATGSNFLERLGKGRHESPTMTSGNNNKNKANKDGEDSELCQDDLDRGMNFTKSIHPCAFSYPEPILRAVNGARQGALAKSISNWHLIGHNEGCCSNTGYILLPCFYGIRLWIWPEPLVAPRVRRALGTRMTLAESMLLWL